MTVSPDIKIRKMILAKQLDKLKTAPVYIEQLSYDANLKKATKRIPTNIRVKPEHWSKTKQEVLKADPDYAKKNQTIHDVYLQNLDPLTVVKTTKGVLEWFDSYIELRKSISVPIGTAKEFTTCKNRVKEFEKHIGSKLYMKDLNLSFSDNFNVWMVTVKKYDSGTVEKTYTILRTFLNHYYTRRDELNIEMNESFREKRWKHGKKSINDPHPVTQADFRILADCNDKLKDNLTLQKTRDRVLFQIATGLRYGDAFTVKPHMIVDGCIKINPSKTRNKKNNTIHINLNHISKSVLEKYDFDTTKLMISNQKYNDNIETLCNKLELSDVYTSHDFRDTFITNAINAEVSIPTILSWTGQESYEVMKRYFKIDAAKKIGDMHKLEIYRNPIYFRKDALDNIPTDLSDVMTYDGSPL